MWARIALPLAVCLALPGCSPYAEFSLRSLAGGDSNLTLRLEARPDPVIARGAQHDVLNPSVIHSPEGYWNFYSAFDGQTWSTALARSADGIQWQPGETIQRPDPRTWEGNYIAANGSALFYGRRFWYWFEAGPRDALRIGLMRGSDPHSWQKEPQPVLERGPYMSWDERDVADPYVIRIDPYFYMYYLGQDRADPPRQRIGLARSTDGIHWTKLRSNPVLELGEPGSFDEADLGEPAVWSSDGFYWMLYTGTDFSRQRRLGLARSTDGVHWEKLSAVFGGTQAWDSKVLCDPTVLVEGSLLRVWFGGGDVASPDENLHGQIGYGILRAARDTLAK